MSIKIIIIIFKRGSTEDWSNNDPFVSLLRLQFFLLSMWRIRGWRPSSCSKCDKRMNRRWLSDDGRHGCCCCSLSAYLPTLKTRPSRFCGLQRRRRRWRRRQQRWWFHYKPPPHERGELTFITNQPSNHPILPGIFHSALVVAFVAAVDDVAKEREQIL